MADLANYKSIGKKGDLRIAWRMANAEGAGEWYAPQAARILQSMVTGMNKAYGTGTHWIEISKGEAAKPAKFVY